MRYTPMVLLWAGTVAALVGAVLIAAEIPFATMRHEAYGLAAFAALLSLLTIVPLGGLTAASGTAASGTAARGIAALLVRAATAAVIALEVLATAQVLRDAPPITGDGGPRTGSGTAVLTVWAVLLTVYQLAVLRATGRAAAATVRALWIAAAGGFGAAGVWLGVALLAPWVAATAVPAVFALICAGAVAGRFGGDRAVLAALLAAVLAALTIVVAMDGLLPLLSGWVRNSAPPTANSQAGAHVARLVDPVGLFLIGGLLSVVLFVIAGARSTSRGARTSPGVTAPRTSG